MKCTYTCIHTDTSLKCSRRYLQVFLCRQGGRNAVRWKPSVTDEKSPPSFLSFSFPLYLPHLALSSILFLFALGILVIAAALSAWFNLFSALHCASFFSLLFPYLVSLVFSSSLLYSERGNWNSFLQSICCHTNACTNTMLGSSFVFSLFLLLFIPAPTKLTIPTPHPYVLLSLMSSQQVA